MTTLFETILLSRPFKFLIGPNETQIVVHEEAIANQSPALDTLIRGEMSESSSGVATWKDVNEQTFMRFAQFAYTGDYSVPTMVVSYQAHQQIQAQKEVEVPPTPFGGFMSNKDSWNFASTSNLVRKDTKTKVVQCSDEEKSQPLSTKHFTTFNKADTYPLLQPRSKFADSCEPEVVAGSEESIDEALLSHNSLYILAEKWGIDSLKALTLFKLHQTLCFFPLDELKVPRIVELARSAYSGTPDLENGIDELRALTCQYIAANSEVMSESTAFTDLIEEGGAFARDLFKCMLPRIR